MKRNWGYWRCVVHGAWTLMALLVLAVSTHGEAVSEEGLFLDSKAVEGLRLSLKADQVRVKAGEPVTFTVTFENVSKEPIRVFWPLAMLVSDQLQVRVSGPDVRRGLMASPMIALMPSEKNFPELAPGEKREYAIELKGNPPSFSSWATHLAAPGVYRIQVVYTYRGAGIEDLIEPGLTFTPWRGTVGTEPMALTLEGDVQPVPGGHLDGENGMLLRPIMGR